MIPATQKELSLLILLMCLLGAEEAAADRQQELDALLESSRQELNLPGLRAAVRYGDGTILQSSVGRADVENNVPLDTSIGMPGGSTGKTFVAALTMLLVEDGTLKLDDMASDWLAETSWFQRLPNAEQIQISHLLTHTTGIGDYPDATSYHLKSFWRALRRGSVRFEPEELIGYVLDRDPLFGVGEGFRYTDAGYLVLGKVIEAASGRDYFELLAERILVPLSLSDIQPANQPVLPNVATGYSRGARNLKRDGRMKMDPTTEWTGGGLVTTPAMLVRFYAALADGQVVTSASFREMLELGWKSSGEKSHYGVGVFVDGHRNAFGHGGMWAGYRTDIIHYFDTGLTIAIQANSDQGFDTEGLIDRVADLALGAP